MYLEIEIYVIGLNWSKLSIFTLKWEIGNVEFPANTLKGSLVFYFNFSFTSWKYNSSWHPMFKIYWGAISDSSTLILQLTFQSSGPIIQFFFKLSTNSSIFIWYLQRHSRRWNPKSCPLVIVDEDVQQALDVVGRPTDKEGKNNWAWISSFNWFFLDLKKDNRSHRAFRIWFS